jgi:tRNA 5-methylaminomethyl-2-thiouridine biosynthesis bifunctional protein
MYESIEPATLAISDNGLPYSERFDDFYHSQDGGLGQARHVFLGGNALPGRWQGRERFVILETGFGLGLNFLASWAAWQQDPGRCGRLHFVSFERHPLCAEDLRQVHRHWPELAPLSDELLRQWPALTPGIHRLWLNDDRVVLTLYFGDAVTGLGNVDVRADAFFLDGFAPAKNPELWSERVCHQLAALAAPDATLATWSVSAQVLRHLNYAHFSLEKTPGFGRRREMLTGHYDGRVEATPAAASDDRRAIVLGAGMAGTSIAHRLARLGWQVEVIDAADGPAMGASGNLAGVLRPLPSLDDNRLARLTRAGALVGRRHLEWLDQQSQPARWGATGVLHLARDPAHERPPSTRRFSPLRRSRRSQRPGGLAARDRRLVVPGRRLGQSPQPVSRQSGASEHPPPFWGACRRTRPHERRLAGPRPGWTKHRGRAGARPRQRRRHPQDRAGDCATGAQRPRTSQPSARRTR